MLGSAMTWSAHETRPAPPPNATPCTQQIVKHGCDQSELNKVSSLFESLLFSSGLAAPASLIIFTSAPAQKCLPSDFKTNALKYGVSFESFRKESKALYAEGGLLGTVPTKLRPLLAGGLCGVTALFLPQTLFVGYATLDDILAGKIHPGLPLSAYLLIAFVAFLASIRCNHCCHYTP